MKKTLLTFVCSLALAVASYGAVTTTANVGASGRVSVVSGTVTSSLFTLQNTNEAKNATFYIFDAPGTNSTYVLSAYTNITYGAQWQTNIYTNYYGVYSSNVYLAKVLYTNSIAQSTNGYSLVGIYTCSSNTAPGVGYLSVPLTYQFRNGILVTNINSGSVSVTYAQ